MNQQVSIEAAGATANGASEIYTTGSVADIFKAQRAAYSANPYPEIAERKETLLKLRQLLIDNDEAIVEAIDKDFGGRSDHEIKLFDISTSIGELGDAAKRLKKWTKVQKRHAHWTVKLTGGRNSVIPQPKGVVGIVTPWNYPLFLAMGPLAAALAAGNRCMVKLAANSQNLCLLMNRLVSEALPQDLVAFIPGVSASEFTAQPYNHLIFTGSAAVGKTVMKKAAEHLTPVTLELGGKSPSIIAGDARLEAAVEKVLMAKCYNAGQTCVAPDYLFVPETKLQQVVEIAQSLAPKWYPAGVDSEDLTSIVDQRAFDRLALNLRDAETKGARIIPLLDKAANETAQKLAPTLVLNPSDDMVIMQEEIFGPLLPIKTYKSIDEAIAYVNSKEHPLALYLFSDDRALQKKVLLNTLSGGVTLNDCIAHVAQHDLPFGGIGNSGMGQYHGYEGFMEFSKLRPVHSAKSSKGPLLTPPYDEAANKLYKMAIKLGL